MEGPSLVILKEELSPFIGRRITASSGNSTLFVPNQLHLKKLEDVKTWGKHLLIQISGMNLRIHFLMFGSYRINDPKEGRDPRIQLEFGKSKVYFYSCSVKILEDPLNETYDWSVDPMSPLWNEFKAVRSVVSHPNSFVCDVLLDQRIFSGVGNIIKNEVLFRLRIHPLTRIKNLSAPQIRKLVRETRNYCFEFYRWKKKFELKRHWQIYRSKFCPICLEPRSFGRTGKLERVSFFCQSCQKLERKAA